MTRGNQREIDRERARKRKEREAPGDKRSDYLQRRDRDAEIMRQKQQQATQKEEEKKAPKR